MTDRRPAASSPAASSPAGPGGDAPGDRSASRRLPDLGPWPLRALWLLLPLTVGGALDALLDGRSGYLVATAAVLAWAAWAASLLATLVAHPVSLTVLRVAGPAAAVSGVGAAAIGRPSLPVAVASVAVGLAAGALAVSAGTADRCVDGVSYGSERRLALRIPTPLLAGPLPLAWLAIVVGGAAGPLLLGAQRWVPGGVALVVGWPAAAFAARSLHGLSRRFIVLVPAGFVLHDRAALLDPVLFSRHAMAHIGPALADTDATDLTLGAAGLVIEVRLVQPLDVPRRRGRRDASMDTVDAVLFSPARPGRLLQLAADHDLPIG